MSGVNNRQQKPSRRGCLILSLSILYRVMERRPLITLTYAQSMDGRIATVTGDSQWISGPQTLRLAHELRDRHEAIMVGVGTVIADDPQLTCRIDGGRNPHRVVLDTTLRTPEGSHVAADARTVPTTVFHARSAPEDDAARALSERAARLASLGVDLRPVATERGRLDLNAILAELHAMGFRSLLVEGGSRLLTSLYAARLVDRVVLVSAPVVTGAGTEAVGDLGLRRLADAWRGTTVGVSQAGDDIVWEISFEHDG